MQSETPPGDLATGGGAGIAAQSTTSAPAALHSRARVLSISALLALLTATLLWSEPYYNWDLLAYLGVAERMGGASPESAHERVFAAARHTVPEPAFELLVQGNEYRRRVAADAGAFDQQLGFYAVKPAYPLLILGLQRMGVDPVRASSAISRVAWVGTAMVLLLWFSSLVGPVAAVAIAWCVASAPFLLDLARLSTPDALSTLLVVGALWLVFQKGRTAAGLAVLFLSIAVRPDNLLWFLPVAGFVALGIGRRRLAALLAPAAILLCVGLGAWAGNHGWRTLFHHSFVEPLAYPAAFRPVLDVVGYLRIYARETHPVNLPPLVLPFAVVLAWVNAVRLRTTGPSDPWTALVVVVAIFAASHWILFPGDDRFFAPAYAALLLGLLRTLQEKGASSGHG